MLQWDATFLSVVIEGGIFIFRINDIIDLPIIEKNSGQRICTAKDVIIDAGENRVYALLCSRGFIDRSMEVIPYERVTGVSQNYITISGRDSMIKLRETRLNHLRYMRYENIVGKLVINSREEILGIIRDLLIDADDGRIIAYELSDGYLDDLMRGRKIVQFDKSCNLAEKNMLLH